MHTLFFRMTYLDPGSGSLLIQLLAAGLLGSIGILTKTFWGRIKAFFTKNKAEDGDSLESDSQQNEE